MISLKDQCLFLEGQWTIQLVSHELSDILRNIDSVEFSSVDGGGIVLWDSLILLFLLACRRRYPKVLFLNFPDELLILSDLYGVKNLIFDDVSFQRSAQ